MYSTGQQANWASSNNLAFEAAYPYLQIISALMCGMLLATASPEIKRYYGPVYALLVSFAMMIAFRTGWVVNLPSLSAMIGLAAVFASKTHRIPPVKPL